MDTRKSRKKQSPSSTTSEQPQRSGILYTQNEGNSLDLNSELIKKEALEGSPFDIVTADFETGKRVWIALGRFKLTEEHERVADAIRDLENNHWNTTLALIAIVVPKEIQGALLALKVVEPKGEGPIKGSYKLKEGRTHMDSEGREYKVDEKPAE